MNKQPPGESLPIFCFQQTRADISYVCRGMPHTCCSLDSGFWVQTVRVQVREDVAEHSKGGEFLANASACS